MCETRHVVMDRRGLTLPGRRWLIAPLCALLAAACAPGTIVSEEGDDGVDAYALIPVPRNAFRGAYYNSLGFRHLKHQRVDATIDFDWAAAAPFTDMGADTFSVRWEGDFDFATGGTYRFATVSDDGIRVSVDGRRIIDFWAAHAVAAKEAVIDVAGGVHRIKVEHYDRYGTAVAKASWALVALLPDAGAPPPADAGPPPQQDAGPPPQQDAGPPQQDASPPPQQDASPPPQQDASPPPQQDASPPPPEDAAGCTPDCAGKQCGADGCGGTCGQCGGGETCNASSQCVPNGGFTGNPASICDPVPITGDRTAGPFPPPPAVSGVSFLSDWPGLANAGGYRYSQVMDACRMQVDGVLTAHGLAALRVEVRAGDDALNSGGERAEALIMQASSGASIFENTTSGTQYYATSYYFPTTWDGTFIHGDSESWSFVMQIWGTGGLSAARHDVGAPQIYQLANNGHTYDFSNGTLALGQWTDLVLMYTWATTATGHITVWRRDQGEAQFTQVLDVANVATLPSAAGSTYYWKQGLYRGASVNGRTDVLWIGPTARGPTFAGVEAAAFGTTSGP